MKLFSKTLGPFISELGLEMFCYLFNVEKSIFNKKKDRLITIRNIFELYQTKIGPKLALLMLFVH